MDRSPGQSNDTQQSTQFSANISNHSQYTTAQSSSGIASMFSPRNIMKFLSKNVQELASPRIASFMKNINEHQPRVQSPFNTDEINRQFSKYIESISQHLQKYKAYRLRQEQILGTQGEKQRQREEIELQVKISKIPLQYFQHLKQEQENLHQKQKIIENLKNSSPKANKQQAETHKSKKLQSLLMMDGDQRGGNNKKRSKQKRAPLTRKQQQLEQYLDQIEIIIFSKTRKYPDRYLNYLSNLNNSDLQLGSLIDQIKKIRVNFGGNLHTVNKKYNLVKKLWKRKEKLAEVLEYMRIMKSIQYFKKQSDNNHIKSQASQSDNTNLKISQLILYIQHYPKLQNLHNLTSISLTLVNIQELGKNIKNRKLQQICKILHKNLKDNLNSTYSKDSWLKSQLPKDILMTYRMKPQIQSLLSNAEENNMNNSFMNISVLDQSYCVGTHTSSAKNEVCAIEIQKEVKQIIEKWTEYCQQYDKTGYKFEQENQQILQILQRSILKFSTTFDKDLQDYISYIYTQKSLNIKLFPTHKERICFIQPKFFNKVSKVYFQALATSLTYAQSFTHLSSTYIKLTKIIEQKVLQIIEMRNITDYSLIQNHVLTYEDVVELLSALDFWFQYAMQITDKAHMLEDDDDDEMNYIGGAMMEFQQNLHARKQKIIDQFLANLHKFSLVNDLKTAIQKSDFVSISIPISSFSVLDFIINWGQALPPQQTSNQNIPYANNEIQQSFNFGADILHDLQNQSHPQKPIRKSIKFSIFKIIDKKLIIQGKQYKICNSLLLLSTYLAIYLKAKTDFVQSALSVDERICELIGFYIWYNKKMIFQSGSAQKNQTHSTGNTLNNLQNIGVATVAKGIGGIKNVIQAYKNGEQQSQKKPAQQEVNKIKAEPVVYVNRKTIPNLCMLANLCQLLLKFIDILNITSKQKKVDKVILDLNSIKNDSEKQISMVPFLQVEKEISSLYESRLKTRKQIPTSETERIIEIIQRSRKNLQEYYDRNNVKKMLENTIKVVSKNYFGYLFNMEARGKTQLKWFLPKLKQSIGDIFPDEVLSLEKQLRY